jgi:hypothetical protein
VTATEASTSTYTALCVREGGWWVITVPELDSGGVTQARRLDQVPRVVADLVATMTGADRASVEVDVRAHAGPDVAKARGLASVAATASTLLRRLSRAA